VLGSDVVVAQPQGRGQLADPTQPNLPVKYSCIVRNF
jgi:hypothetical protein